MKITIIIMMALVTLSVQAYEYQCKVQNRESNGLKISKLLINSNVPTLTVMNDRDNSRLQLIDDIYLGLLTEPMAWALRSECELTQDVKKILMVQYG